MTTEFLQSIRDRLRSLTAPDEHKIKSFAMIADEHRQLAKPIADLIVSRCRELRPEHRLPVLYLLDCIVKNDIKKSDPVYVNAFSPMIVKLFVSTYNSAPSKIRRSLVKLLGTWERPRPVFPPIVLQQIRTALDALENPQKRPAIYPPTHQPPPPRKRRAPQPIQWNTLRELFVNLEQNLASNVAAAEIRDIMRLLHEAEKGRPFQPLARIHRAIGQLHDRNREAFQHPSVGRRVVEELESVMVRVGMDKPPTILSSISRSAAPAQRKPKERVYARRKKIDFSSESLKGNNPGCIDRLYKKFPIQCNVCGMRFPEKEAMASHLDWHFQINRKKQQRQKHGGSQPWYLAEEDWVQRTGDTDLGEETQQVPSFLLDQDEPQEKKQEVSSVPADESQTNCPVCGEKFDLFWDDTNDAWMCKDAVKTKYEDTLQILHQACSQDS